MQAEKLVKFVCLSDTHFKHKEINVPIGDVLIHAGDFTQKSTLEEVLSFKSFLQSLPHQYKVVIPGNHDILKIPNEGTICEPSKIKELLQDVCVYLDESSVTLFGYKIYGSSWLHVFAEDGYPHVQEKYPGEKCQLIPSDADIVITHPPPYLETETTNTLDLTASGMKAGDKALAKDILTRIKPLYHIFGHIHEGYGQGKIDNTTFINASSCTKGKKTAGNPPICFELLERRISLEKNEMNKIPKTAESLNEKIRNEEM